MSKWLGRIGAILVFFLVINISVNGIIKYVPMTEQEYSQTAVAKMSEGIKTAKKNAVNHILEITGYTKSAGISSKKDSKDTVSDMINKIFKVNTTRL